MHMQSLNHQHQPDHHQEGNSQKFHGRMVVYKIADPGSECQHNSESDTDCDNDDQDLVNKADSGQDRIQGEDNVQQHDLDNSGTEGQHFHFMEPIIFPLDL